MIICFYVALRNAELPIMLYIIVLPYAGLTILVVLFWICHDATVVVQAPEKLLSQLRSDGSPYLARLTRVGKKKILLRSRAMLPLAFPIALATLPISHSLCRQTYGMKSSTKSFSSFSSNSIQSGQHAHRP